MKLCVTTLKAGEGPWPSEHAARGRLGPGWRPRALGQWLWVQPGRTHLLIAHSHDQLHQRMNPGIQLSAGEAARDKQQTPQNMLLSENEI